MVKILKGPNLVSAKNNILFGSFEYNILLYYISTKFPHHAQYHILN